MGGTVLVKRFGRLNSKNEIVVDDRLPKGMAAEVAAVITNLTVPETEDETDLHLQILIGQGTSARSVTLDIAFPTRVLQEQLTAPLNVDTEYQDKENKGQYAVFMFRNLIFAVSGDINDSADEEEAILHIKKQTYAEDYKLKRLRQEVEVMERLLSGEGVKREAIPDTVKLIVWNRDEGKCVRCGAREKFALRPHHSSREGWGQHGR